MDLRYVFACGIVWRYTADPEAGWELLRALRDEDRDVQELAALILADKTQDTSSLLNAALAGGAVGGKDVAEGFGTIATRDGAAGIVRDSRYGAS